MDNIPFQHMIDEYWTKVLRMQQIQYCTHDQVVGYSITNQVTNSTWCKAHLMIIITQSLLIWFRNNLQIEIVYKNKTVDSLTHKATTVLLLLMAISLFSTSCSATIINPTFKSNFSRDCFSIYRVCFLINFRIFQACYCFHSFLFH